MIRKVPVLIIFIPPIAYTSRAQSLELTPIAGYTFLSTANITGGEARINDGFTYGGTLTYSYSPDNAIEISYYRYATDAVAYSGYDNITTISLPVAVNYMLIGSQRLFPVKGKVAPLVGFNLGAAWLGSGEDSFSTVPKYALGFDAGVKIKLNEKIGVRLQSNLNFPLSGSDSFFWSSGNTDVVVSGNVPIWSFGFNVGFIYKLK
jgi:long-subunit fatty acid transport protein